jgi:hypothetical protein
MERAEHGWSKMQTSRIDFSKGDDDILKLEKREQLTTVMLLWLW